ncbi:hypothetical protein RB200_23935 [Streptomyces sp. PmtG]
MGAELRVLGVLAAAEEVVQPPVQGAEVEHGPGVGQSGPHEGDQGSGEGGQLLIGRGVGEFGGRAGGEHADAVDVGGALQERFRAAHAALDGRAAEAAVEDHRALEAAAAVRGVHLVADVRVRQRAPHLPLVGVAQGQMQLGRPVRVQQSVSGVVDEQGVLGLVGRLVDGQHHVVAARVGAEHAAASGRERPQTASSRSAPRRARALRRTAGSGASPDSGV